MKVFISWSGERSRLMAEALREWLPTIIQAVDPWVSSEDINKGGRWGSEIAEQLEKSQIGIICLTKENMEAPWILFEAGTLSKAVGRSFVCPYLLDLKPTDIKGPLGLFQATICDKVDTRKLVDTINQALEEKKRLPKDRLDKIFERGWPELEKLLKDIPLTKAEMGPIRSDRELFEEILSIVREVNRIIPFGGYYSGAGLYGPGVSLSPGGVAGTVVSTPSGAVFMPSGVNIEVKDLIVEGKGKNQQKKPERE